MNNLYNNIYSTLYSIKSEDNAIAMKKYMRNQFEFMGITSPDRRAATKQILKDAKATNSIDWEFINIAWDCEYRELQLVVIDYLELKKKHLSIDNLPQIRNLIEIKSWWDTVDFLSRYAGYIVMNNDKQHIMLDWSADNNIWVRRTAIIHQLLIKDKTNTDILAKVIMNNFGTNEFFINKAIGWALRDYSKTNSVWVSNFINQYKDKLAPLSIREGSKYI